ncbi:DNA polymerase III subunit beta family protein [[Mycoplasma] collis]|uniref:DNA polymerase III subunit beta family protein n=1 Tax=[Mycoplasma] collis TaxID=2127 RepID=UPI00051BBFEF|nr:hypothetical protein [[Mycoplasma] collis]
MEFKIYKKDFEKNLDNVGYAINSTNFSILLRGIFLEVINEGVYFYGSDSELTIKTFIDKNKLLELNKNGKVLINFLLLKNIVKKLQGELTIKLEGNFLVIYNNDDKFKLNVMDYSDYPALDFTPVNGIKFKVNAKEIKKAIRNTIFATNSESIEFVLSCLNLVAKNSKLTISATDKYRIARETINIDTNSEFDISIYAKKLKDFFPHDYDDDVEIKINEYKIETKIEDVLIQSKIAEFPYKDISKAFPKQEDIKYKIEIDKKELSNLINKATAISSENSYKLEFKVNNEEFIISSYKDEMGSILVRTKNFSFLSENKEDTELQFNLNYKFLKEAISVFEDRLHIFVDSAIKRVLILSSSYKNNKQLIGTT